MKQTILKKLLVIMLILTLIPLIVVSFVAVNQAKTLGLNAAEDAKMMGDNTIVDSTNSLNSLGESIIKQKAVDVAKQMEIYIKDHPTMTVEDLQADEYFKAIAVQPVGETGYTAITDVASLICRFHANPKIVNMDLHNLAEPLPGFWGVMSQSEGGNPVSGYYDWKEADGSFKQKYMYIAITDAQTADGVTLSVASTTYIDEFSKPVMETKEKINFAVTSTTKNIEVAANKIQTILIVITIITLIIVIFVTFAFAKSISTPIKKLKEAADKVTSGEDAKLPAVRGTDEVAELTGSMEMLITAFKAKTGKKK